MIEQESDSDSVASGEQKKVKSNGSILSEEDLLNRSLESEGDEAIDPNNFLRYASEKVN
jgi:Zn-dependent M32 family carboxypeptidase